MQLARQPVEQVARRIVEQVGVLDGEQQRLPVADPLDDAVPQRLDPQPGCELGVARPEAEQRCGEWLAAIGKQLAGSVAPGAKATSRPSDRPARRSTPAPRSWAASTSASSSRDLPIPASPVIVSTVPRPARACSSRSSQAPNSRSRPTSGRARRRVAGSASRVGAKALTGSPARGP